MNNMNDAGSKIPRIGYLGCIFILLFSSFGHAQLLTPLSNEMNRRVEYEMMKNNTPFFTVMKPYVDTQLRGNARQDSLYIIESRIKNQGSRQIESRIKNQESRQIQSSNGQFCHDVLPKAFGSTTHDSIESRIKNQESRQIQSSKGQFSHDSPSWLKRKLFHESFIQVDSGDYYLFADPVFEFGLGKEKGGNNTFINTRGFRAGGRLENHFAFGLDFYENQGIFNSAITQKIKKTWIAPGEGLARKYDSIGYDYAYSSGYVSIFLNKLNIQLARGRQFIGDGYRSLLLSDASYTYPYLKLTWQNEFFFYSWCNMLLQEYGFPNAVKSPPFRKKSASLYTIGLNIKNKVQLTLVKMQLYNNPDSVGDFVVHFEQFNPLLLPVHSTLGHSIWGLNLKMTPVRNLTVYSQWVLDNLLSNHIRHTAIQTGAKSYVSWGKNIFFFNMEYNRVPSKTYESDNTILNWRHYTEPLAHPYGNNFEEGILIGSWSYKRFQLYGQMNVARQLEKMTGNKLPSQNTFNYFPNGKKLFWYKTEFTYFLNTKTLMNISVGYNYRKEELATSPNQMNYFYFSFGTRLFNKYYDF